MNTKSFCRIHNITSEVTETGENPNMDDFQGRHYKVTLKFNRKQLTVPFSCGYGIEKEPDEADVLDCLASDASGDFRDFESWCSDYGYDTDSRKAEKTFKAIVPQTDKLKKFLGDKLFTELLNADRM